MVGRSLAFAAFGASASVTGLLAGRCNGGCCHHCLACLLPATSMLLLAVGHRLASHRRSVPWGSAAVPVVPVVVHSDLQAVPASANDRRASSGDDPAEALSTQPVRA